MVFRCEPCEQNFVWKRNYTHHMGHVHGVWEREPTYKCEICDRMFVKRCNMERHKKTICLQCGDGVECVNKEFLAHLKAQNNS